MKVVLESNVVLSGFFFGGVAGTILEAWHAGRFKLVLSISILAEYREAGAELESRYGGSDFEAFATLLTLRSEVVAAPNHFADPVCAHPDDDKFLTCAIAAGAGAIVSGDRHLLDVNGWRAIQVQRGREADAGLPTGLTSAAWAAQLTARTLAGLRWGCDGQCC